MDFGLLAVQVINGIQFGFMLFLIAAGLTLVFGILDFANLAHGTLFMIGAYLLATVFTRTESLLLGIVLATLGTGLVGLVLDKTLFRFFYGEDHLSHFLLTFGLIMALGEAVRVIWGPFALSLPVPAGLDGSLVLPGDVVVPSLRLLIIAVGAVVAAALFLAIKYTRVGMLVRASAQDREMVTALGVNVRRLYLLVLTIGSALAGLAGALVAPLSTVESGMGDRILILTFVVVVIGGMGSVKGAFVAAMLVGVVDTVGRTTLPIVLGDAIGSTFAAAAGPGIASVVVYVIMAVILFARPQGLLPAGGR